MNRNLLALAFLLGSFTLTSTAQADTSPRVARISVIDGDVSAQRVDTGDWSAAALNQPLVGGDRIATGDHSKVELQLDHANIVRLGNNSQAKIAAIERSRIQIQIGQGLAYYIVFQNSEDEVEIDTPNATIQPVSTEGIYRIEVSGFETQVIVRTGAVDISTPQGSTRVEMGQAATIRGTTDEAGYVLGGAPSKDVWDSWNSERDGLIRNAQSWNYTSRYYVGSEDLDAHGHWVSLLDYGSVWVPTVASGWIPYRSGRWIWEPYWGWTWVSKESWGWAPYHYGRWFLYGKSWMWWPGPVEGGTYRPAWAPAYVAFFGFGARPGVSGGFGRLGWLPIGPGDFFYPWYGQDGSHSNSVNATDATDAVYLNRESGVVAPLIGGSHFSSVGLAAIDSQVRKAISTLPADHFGTGRGTPKTISQTAFRHGNFLTGSLPIAPTRETLSATNRPSSFLSTTASGRRERFFAKRQPPPPQSFDEHTARAHETIPGSGQIVPAREVTHVDPVAKEQPMPIENAIERIIQRTKNVRSEDGSKSHPSTISKARPKTMRRRTALEHGLTGRVVSRPGRVSHAVASATVPTSASRTALPKSRGVITRPVHSYVDSANRQMDKGNYAAAIANYKRAWQLDGNSAAAKARLGRAKRAMQAENEIIANRR